MALVSRHETRDTGDSFPERLEQTDPGGGGEGLSGYKGCANITGVLHVGDVASLSTDVAVIVPTEGGQTVEMTL